MIDESTRKNSGCQKENKNTQINIRVTTKEKELLQLRSRTKINSTFSNLKQGKLREQGSRGRGEIRNLITDDFLKLKLLG